MIAINRTWELCPWADVLYSSGASFWREHDPDFGGLKVAGGVKWPGTVYDDVNAWLPADKGLRNSGAQAIVYAEAWGASRILLTGFDMQGKHWHPCHKDGNPYVRFPVFRVGLGLLAKEMNIPVINCSRETALACFPRMTIDEALA